MSVICRTRTILALVATMAVLALAGCSGGDSDATTAADSAAAAAVEPAAPVEPEAPRISALEDALQRGVEITAATGSDADQAPEFTGLTKWLNSPPLTMTELQGEVVMVDFWTYT